MKFIIEGDGFGKIEMFLEKRERRSVQEFHFDDEPLESILYDAQDIGPTRANFYWPAMQYVRTIVELLKAGNITSTLEKAAELGEKGHLLSLRTCHELVLVMRIIVPEHSNPVITHDLSGLGPLLANIWDIVSVSGNKWLLSEAGTVFYRWNEFHQRYEEARKILLVLIQLYRDIGSRLNEAIMTNNFGFEYLLEGRWRDGIAVFEEAANMFDKCGDKANRANALANYWICRLECGDVDELEKNEGELAELQEALRESPSWHRRKPFIIRARLEEYRGHIEKAVDLIKEAINIPHDSRRTRYPEMDRQYLGQLESKMGRNSTDSCVAKDTVK